jgi:hypothetical protein
MFAWTREERIIRTNRTLELSLQAAGPVSCAACAWLATRTDSRRTPARTPRLRSRPIRGPGPPAGRPARRSAGAAATPGGGSDPCQRNRPRSRRATAVRITACCSCRARDIPDPASLRSRPARRTRTAGTPGPVPSPGGWPGLRHEASTSPPGCLPPAGSVPIGAAHTQVTSRQAYQGKHHLFP